MFDANNDKASEEIFALFQRTNEMHGWCQLNDSALVKDLTKKLHVLDKSQLLPLVSSINDNVQKTNASIAARSAMEKPFAQSKKSPPNLHTKLKPTLPNVSVFDPKKGMSDPAVTSSSLGSYGPIDMSKMNYKYAEKIKRESHGL